MNRALLSASAALLIAGCQTTSPEEAAEQGAVLTGTPIPYTPSVTHATLQFSQGQYPTLFSGASSATWALPGAPTGAPADPLSAPAPTAGGLHSFQVTLISEFPDMSIAYDAVGLRGINVYLLTPNGSKIKPAQVTAGNNLREEPRGALRLFSRTNTLLFAPGDLVYSAPAPGVPPQPMRLVLEGYSSTYHFEFPAAIPATISNLPFAERPAGQKLHNAHDRFRNWSHKFD